MGCACHDPWTKPIPLLNHIITWPTFYRCTPLIMMGWWDPNCFSIFIRQVRGPQTWIIIPCHLPLMILQSYCRLGSKWRTWHREQWKVWRTLLEWETAKAKIESKDSHWERINTPPIKLSCICYIVLCGLSLFLEIGVSVRSSPDDVLWMFAGQQIHFFENSCLWDVIKPIQN